MLYLLTILATTAVPIPLGYAYGRRGRARTGVPVFRAALAGVGLAGVWALTALGARAYAETDFPGWAMAEWWAHAGKWYAFETALLAMLGFAVGRQAAAMRRARRLLAAGAALLVVWSTVWKTVPVYAFLPRTTRRDADGHMRQSVEYTCGPVSLGNLLERAYGAEPLGERQLARLCGTTVEGTPLSALRRAARKCGLRVVACRRLTLAELERLRVPAIVSIRTLPAVRHATVLLRIDDTRVHLIDPAYGPRVYAKALFLKRWYGKALVLAGEPPAAGQAERRGTPFLAVRRQIGEIQYGVGEIQNASHEILGLFSEKGPRHPPRRKTP
ncbi:MAG: hypothetical protein JXR37_09385 [Kiritimatiellae bacterium]|nr:hypothetical protein [Kiritimatiellia bacterium]